MLDSAIRAPLSLLSPRMKIWTRKPSETAEPQQRQNPKTHRMKQLHHIPKSYFLIVLKAKNNPSFFFLCCRCSQKVKQTFIFLEGNIYTLSIFIKNLDSTGQVLEVFWGLLCFVFFFKAVSTLLLIMSMPENG